MKKFAGENRRMTVASRYAQALFAFAAEGKTQPAVATAVTALAEAVREPTIAATLANPRLTPAQRQQLAAAMAKATKAPQALANTLGVLAENNRLSKLAGVAEAYLELNDTASGITHVKVATATPLTEAQRTKLADLIKKQAKSADVRLEETLDITLQGGFRAYFNGMVWDASLSGQVSRLATRLRAAITQHQN